MKASLVGVNHFLIVELKALKGDKIKETSKFKRENSALKKSLDAAKACNNEIESRVSK